MVNVIDRIIDFNVDRNLETFNAETEYNLLDSELHEFFTAYAEYDEDNPNDHDLVDSLCDIVVVAVGALHKLGYCPDAALHETTKEIMSRTGSLNEVTGKWEKDLVQDPLTSYVADYTNAKYP